ncbi:ABC-2 type transport system ATP-binding protein [Spinactinospora alkalitolerans]|uniref:ABC-2 type transport system ATP-binding protein n=1 Tax=Spinactinospora alkalitolerans TaxID=687207 RepID=A0A852TRC0_9ACTN|nr:ATP-binding cassette domain-containing protein [Spinactinospora alkalitolerans]NYE45382.1 ABC-2 type transport system ATP-binding protein [Spinactinospora alkalitolerans]
MDRPVIEAVGLIREFGGVTALDGVGLHVCAGEVLGLLGHNGAGKTTLVDILTTLIPPTGGTARVAGCDVVAEGREVRRRIGVAGQFSSVDVRMSGCDNLVFVARLLGAGRRAARERTERLLEAFGLAEAAGRPAAEYSGGMLRRLDLAACLLGSPEAVFLDEPTTGLDPAGRAALWSVVEELAAEGCAVLLTTQYLEEADRLADRITVLSRGRVAAEGTAAELKAGLGSLSVSLSFGSGADRGAALRVLREAGFDPYGDGERTVVPIDAPRMLAGVVRSLDASGLEPSRISLDEPTLDDVFAALTRRPAP